MLASSGVSYNLILYKYINNRINAFIKSKESLLATFALDQMRSLLTVGVGGIISSIGSGNSGGLTGNLACNYSIVKLAYYR